MKCGHRYPRKGDVGVCSSRNFFITGSSRLAGMILPGKVKPGEAHLPLAVSGSKIAPVSTVMVLPSHAGEATCLVFPVKCSEKSPFFSFWVQLSWNPGV